MSITITTSEEREKLASALRFGAFSLRLLNTWGEEELTIFGEHPIPMRPPLDGGVLFVGSLGISDSVKRFAGVIMREIAYDNVKPSRMIFHLFECEDNPDQHVISAELIDQGYASYMCDGMTDHSGEGGAAFGKLRRFFELLAFLFELKVEFIVHKAQVRTQFEERILAEQEIERYEP